MIGHLGISTSRGLAFDFAGPYTVLQHDNNHLLFGPVTRYLPLDPRLSLPLACGSILQDYHAAWDSHLAATATDYRKNKDYNIFTRNCHQFVCSYLSGVAYKGCTSWNMVALAARMFLMGRFVSPCAVLHSLGPSAVLFAVGAYFGRLYFLYAWLGIAVPLVLWFVLFTAFGTM